VVRSDPLEEDRVQRLHEAGVCDCHATRRVQGLKLVGRLEGFREVRAKGEDGDVVLAHGVSKLWVLQIVHELHAHAVGEYDWLDFDALEECEDTEGLDGPFLRFSLASIGIKLARSLYRKEDQRDIVNWELSPNEKQAVLSKSLLNCVENFDKEQNLYRPESLLGYWNLGWMSTQVKHNS